MPKKYKFAQNQKYFTLDSSGVNSDETVKLTTINETKSIPITQAITPINRPK